MICLVLLLKRIGFSTKESFIPSLLESRTLNWFAFWVSLRKQRILSNIFFQVWRNWLWGFRCCTAGCKLDASLVLTSILFCKLSSNNLAEWGWIKNAQFKCAKKRILILPCNRTIIPLTLRDCFYRDLRTWFLFAFCNIFAFSKIIVPFHYNTVDRSLNVSKILICVHFVRTHFYVVDRCMVFYIKAGARDDVDDDVFHFIFPEPNECVNSLSHIVECIVLTATPTNSGSSSLKNRPSWWCGISKSKLIQRQTCWLLKNPC